MNMEASKRAIALFQGMPGRTDYRTGTEVRAAVYRVVRIHQDEQGQWTQTQVQTRIASSRVLKYLRRIEADFALQPGAQGFAVVAACRPANLGRVWVLPLGNPKMTIRQHLAQHETVLATAAKILVGAGAERRLLRGATDIETELGITACRTEWRAIRSAATGNQRSSHGVGLIAMHPELFAEIIDQPTREDALAAMQELLWKKTALRVKTRDMETYLSFVWPVVEASRRRAQADRPGLYAVA